MKKTSDKEKEQLDAVLITSREEASKLEEKRVKEQEKMNAVRIPDAGKIMIFCWEECWNSHILLGGMLK